MPPRSTRRKQAKTGDGRVAVKISVDGESYLFDTSVITHRHELALWNQARLTYAEVFTALNNEKPAMFMLAALVFLAQISAGEKVAYDDVAEAITYSSEIDIEILDDTDAETEAPEVPAAD